MAKQLLGPHELTPVDADFLNPAVWGGHCIGDGDAGAYRSVPLGLRSTVQAIKGIRIAHNALFNWAGRKRGAEPAFVYYGNMAFPATEFPGAKIILDQEVLITCGAEPFSLDRQFFPDRSPFQPANVVSPKPHYVEGARMRYLRQGVAVVTIEGENGPQQVMATSMENHVGTNEYYRQVGVLAVPPVVQLGAVTHLEMQGGHEIFIRTNNAFVFPDSGPVVHVPSAPAPQRA